jgi:hypothetical protein
VAPEHNDSEIPDWAQRERQQDMAWVRQNVLFLWPLAGVAFGAFGRGALAADVAAPSTQEGLRLGYLTQDTIETAGNAAMKRIVREYDPAREFVMVFLKSSNRASTYRVRSVDQDHPEA